MTIQRWLKDGIPMRGLVLIIGTFFHLCYVLSIFDIYFRSPVIHGMTPHRVAQDPPAKRLVLIVGDGLRADKLFQLHPDPALPNDQTRTQAPFLRSIVQHYGTFGVSHTRVPTESRPGHVALIAGMYEDVSAVTKGWKENPVNFDSVFNQSTKTWALGSPDIIRMFQTGASDKEKVDAIMYGAEEEDFTKDPTNLDRWVFEEFEQLLSRSKRDRILNKQLRSDGVIFFLHLLGLDTSGHAFRPSSEEYLHNIEVVDAGIERTVRMVEEFFNRDGRTSYIFTADHGMSDRGNHGDGHPDNTRTPLVAWGAGLHSARLSEDDGPAQGHDGFSADWDLDRVERFDVAQADIAPLMATLVGIHHPMNSVGEMPLHYLNMPDRFIAESAVVNSESLMEQYRLKAHRKSLHTLFFKPFTAFTGHHNSVEERFAALAAMIENEDYEQVVRTAINLNKITLQGIRYLDTYDRLILRIIVTSGYIGWIIFATLFILKVFVIPFDPSSAREVELLHANPSWDEIPMLHWIPRILASISILSFLFQRSPSSYYLYTAFPIFYLDQILQDRHLLKLASNMIADDPLKSTYSQYAQFGLKSVLALATLQCMVAGYFDRRIWSAGFVLLAFAWPASMPYHFLRAQLRLVTIWSILCLLTAHFTLLPVELAENLDFILAGGILSLVISTYVLFDYLTTRALFQEVKLPFKKDVLRSLSDSRRLLALYICGILFILTTMFTTYSSVTSIRAKHGLPFGYQVSNWSLLVSSLLLSSLAPANTRPSERVFLLGLSFMPLYIILTESYEGLFFVAFTCTLATWCALETKLYATTRPFAGSDSQGQRPLALDDVRIGLFFLFFIHVGFFGTGNVASISSFYLNPVYRLIPTFQPFPMAALLIFKMLIPFVMVCTMLGMLTRNIDLDPFGLFMAIFALGDILSLNFFFLVRDSGSWLDIGQSISHFIISSFFTFSNFVVFSLVVKEERFDVGDGTAKQPRAKPNIDDETK